MAVITNIFDQYANAGTALHDAIKTLRTNIGFSSMDKELKTIVVTSVVPHDGKSTLTIFLGMAMAESGQRTLLVECDCRKPKLQNYLKIRPTFSLMDVLSKRVEPREAIVPTNLSRLSLLSSMVLANPVEILGSNRFQSVMDGLKSDYDIILFDTPPLGSFIEAALLASKADGTILVLQSGSTDVTAAQAVVAQLEKAKARVLGVVLNGVEATSDDYYYADYYYGDKSKRKKKPAKAKSPVQNKPARSASVSAPAPSGTAR